MAKNIRFGIVGMGNMGRTHRQYFLDGKIAHAQLTAIVERRAQTELVPGEQRFENAEEMFNAGVIDAVIIATPHPTHYELGVAALKAGLHVMMEKPLGVHTAEIDRLLAAHTNPQQIFGAMFQVRTDPHYVELKRLIQSGELGAVRRVLWDTTDWFRTERYYAGSDWRATWRGEGGGVLLNQCPHNLDVFQWLFGLPQEVVGFCQFGRYHQIEVEDDITLYARWADGKHATIIASTGEVPGRNRLEIACDHGHVTVETGRIVWQRTAKSNRDFSEQSEAAFAKPEVEEVIIPIADKGPGHIGVLENFVHAIRDGVPLIAPAAEGRGSIELANAALLSTWLGQPVTLPLDAAQYEKHLVEKISGSTFQKKVMAKSTASVDDFARSFQR
jgi:predicted dehydrogenase